MDKLQEVLLREPIERSLLKGTQMLDVEWDAGMFVNLTMSQQNGKGPQTPPGLVEYVRHEIEATCAAASGEDERQFAAYMRGLEQIWPALKAKMEASYGLAEYMRTLACHSTFLPHYYATLYHPLALEAAFAWAKRLDGQFMRVPTSDPAYKLCAREPIFRTTTWRAAKNQLVMLQLGSGAKLTSLGAGVLPECNHFGWQERGIKQDVIAYDTAAGVLECVKEIYTKPLGEYGIDYRVADFWDAFKDPAQLGARDLVLMSGGMSYYVKQTDDLMQGIASILRPGGHFCGEVELMHIYTIRCGVLGWVMDQQMLPDKDAESAIARVSVSAQKAGLKVVEACVDDRNVQPAAVWFHLEKP